MIPNTIRFHKSVKHVLTNQWLPAMVSAIEIWPRQQVVGIHIVFLSKDGKGKAKVKRNKQLLGKASGGAVRLAPLKGNRLNLAEGLETALSVYLMTGITTWAALSAPNLETIILPPPEQVLEVFIYADFDDSGIKSANKLAARLVCLGHKVKIIVPKHKGWDFNDVRMGGRYGY